MRRLFEYGGFVAAVVLIGFGIGAVTISTGSPYGRAMRPIVALRRERLP